MKSDGDACKEIVMGQWSLIGKKKATEPRPCLKMVCNKRAQILFTVSPRDLITSMCWENKQKNCHYSGRV